MYVIHIEMYQTTNSCFSIQAEIKLDEFGVGLGEFADGDGVRHPVFCAAANVVFEVEHEVKQRNIAVGLRCVAFFEI